MSQRRAVRLTDAIEADCPFCAGYFLVGDPYKSDAAVVHTMPTCETFRRLDPTTFLRAVNVREAGRASAN
mgnify:CR=1 FL=1